MDACSKMADGGLRQFYGYLPNLVRCDNDSALMPFMHKFSKRYL